MPLFSSEREHIIPTALWLPKMITKKKTNVHFLLLLAQEFASYNNGCKFKQILTKLKAQTSAECGGISHIPICLVWRMQEINRSTWERACVCQECVEIWNKHMLQNPSHASPLQVFHLDFIKIWATLQISATAQARLWVCQCFNFNVAAQQSHIKTVLQSLICMVYTMYVSNALLQVLPQHFIFLALWPTETYEDWWSCPLWERTSGISESLSWSRWWVRQEHMGQD